MTHTLKLEELDGYSHDHALASSFGSETYTKVLRLHVIVSDKPHVEYVVTYGADRTILYRGELLSEAIAAYNAVA